MPTYTSLQGKKTFFERVLDFLFETIWGAIIFLILAIAAGIAGWNVSGWWWIGCACFVVLAIIAAFVTWLISGEDLLSAD